MGGNLLTRVIFDSYKEVQVTQEHCPLANDFHFRLIRNRPAPRIACLCTGG